MTVERDDLIAAAQRAAGNAYAPYSRFAVGAALVFEDGAIVTGANMENASFGLSLCAETIAVASAMNAGRRGGLVAIAVTGGPAQPEPVMPCGRCRQVLAELAQRGGTDPMVWSGTGEHAFEARLSQLLPHAFGPASLR